MTKKLYTAIATVKGGRNNGHGETSDGKLIVDLRPPVELGGPEGKYTNPEQLFAIGYAACFEGALSLQARLAKIHIDDPVITSQVSLNNDEAGGYFISVEMNVHIPGVTKAVVEDLIAKAHQNCPYSKATLGNIEVKFTVLE